MNNMGGNSKRRVLALGESVKADGREGIIVMRAEVGQPQYYVQFDDDALAAKWVARGDLMSAA